MNDTDNSSFTYLNMANILVEGDIPGKYDKTEFKNMLFDVLITIGPILNKAIQVVSDIDKENNIESIWKQIKIKESVHSSLVNATAAKERLPVTFVLSKFENNRKIGLRILNTVFKEENILRNNELDSSLSILDSEINREKGDAHNE